ncbi:MAG TPA: hypothetical protein VN408_28760, partial [Actinoplanes sp.]|nr:hypothetical protein [Actinoplanes sp.]
MTQTWHAAAQALLEPGEHLLAAEEMRLADGVTPPPPPAPADTTPLSLPGKVGLAFLHLLSPNFTLPGEDRL